MVKYLIKAFILMILISSCRSGEKKLEKQLYEEVMNTHDEVMPKMGAIMKLKKQLQTRSDSLSAIDSLRGQERIISIIQELEDANESMMKWMRQFEQIDEGTPHGEVIQYLLEQKKSIDKVKKDMMDSKDRAEKYILEAQ